MNRPRINPTLGNRLITIGLGTIVAAAGGFFSWYLWDDFRASTAMSDWEQRPCEILASTIDQNGETQHGAVRYQVEIRYRYFAGGEFRISDKVKPYRPVASAHRSMVEGWQGRYPAGSEGYCYVNPENPDEAVLELDTKAAGYSIWFPALFVVGGIGIALSGFRRSKAMSPAPSDASAHR